MTEFNEAPVARITSPEMAEEKAEGDLFTARGVVKDEDDPVDQLKLTWYLGDEFRPQCIDVPPLDDGLTACDFALGAENEEISLEVIDPSGKSHWDAVNLVAIPAQGPVVVITEPLNRAGYYHGEKIHLGGEVHDTEDPSSALRVWWESDLDGELALDQETDLMVGDDGLVSSFYDDLSEGTHALRLWCEDTSGRSNFNEIMIDIWGPPTAAITSPDDEFETPEGEMVTFVGTVSDAHDYLPSLSLMWMSSIDGILDTSPADSNGATQFATDTLSPGNHEIELSVLDSHNMSDNAIITIEVIAADNAGD